MFSVVFFVVVVLTVLTAEFEWVGLHFLVPDVYIPFVNVENRNRSPSLLSKWQKCFLFYSLLLSSLQLSCSKIKQTLFCFSFEMNALLGKVAARGSRRNYHSLSTIYPMPPSFAAWLCSESQKVMNHWKRSERLLLIHLPADQPIFFWFTLLLILNVPREEDVTIKWENLYSKASACLSNAVV